MYCIVFLLDCLVHNKVNFSGFGHLKLSEEEIYEKKKFAVSFLNA
jgi:hypothetical protein